ncbi:MAG: hypothetical protein DMF68_02850 [Acidobacteria bacterium]|nr:MAG: hypothetical protein DMF68_02850 [Acidobacteriota bacterium]
MSDEQIREKTAQRGREKIRVRVDRLRQSRKRSIIGVPELVGLAASALMLLAVVFAYLYFYSPAQSRLATAQLERARLQQRLSTLQKDVDVKGNVQENVNNISQSLEQFDERLTGRDEGRVTLYNTLIQLIRSNNLRNTSGPAYTYLEAKGENQNQGPKIGNTKWQSLYPGITVTVTVEGQYANLRHFLRDIEASSQFIIINEVELERAADADALAAASAAAPLAAPATPKGQAAPPQQQRSALVSLKVNMAAYYRREGSSEAIQPPPPPQNQAR